MSRCDLAADLFGLSLQPLEEQKVLEMPTDNHAVTDEETTQQPFGERVGQSAEFQHISQEACCQDRDQYVTRIEPFLPEAEDAVKSPRPG